MLPPPLFLKPQSDQKMSDAPLSKRLDDLEIKFSYQQETIDSLNEAVTKQWSEIEALRRQLHRLEGRLQEMSDMQSDSGNEPPPPHY